MEKQELTSAGINLKSKSDPISIWWNTPSLRSHYIILDEYDDFEDVYNAVQDLGVSCAENREFELYESTTTLATILSFLSVFLFLATFIISAIMIIQSIIFYTKNRKGEIGMIKALGYKNKDIFMYIYFEHLWLSLSGCFIGGVISAIFIAIANFIFSNGDYVYQRYIISWSNYGIFFAISVIVAVLLPLICQLFTLRKINNIQPREAMN
jgi:putative ABC transport system permease protein